MPSHLDRDFVATYLRPQRGRALVLAGLLLAGIAFQLANPQIAKTFLDSARHGAPFARLVHLAVVFLVLALLTQVAVIAETFVAVDLGWRTTNALRVDLVDHVLSLDDAFHADHPAGEMIERLDGDVSAIAGFFARFVVYVAGNALFLLGVLVLLWVEDWRIGALLTAFSGMAVLVMTRRGGTVRTRARRARAASADLSSFLEERLAGLPDIKANGADAHVLRGFDVRLGTKFRESRSASLAASVFADSINLLFVVGTGLSLSLAAVLHHAGAISLGGVFLVFRYTGMLRVPLERLSRHLNGFQQAMGAIGRIAELRAAEPRLRDDGDEALPAGPLAVELDHVSFAYHHELVLRDVSVTLPPGEVLGLLGRTGAGKTTITRLVFRLVDATEGVVRVGGRDVRNVGLGELRGRIALVTQDVQLFSATLRENVTLFDDEVPDERVADAFAQLGLGAWVRELPDGLDTRLGGHGRGLSAGEAQLVALARAFLGDPGLVVLDEASSRLDPRTERLLESAIDRLLHGRTGIVIAHRLASVDRADRIVIVEDGAVAESGQRAALADDPDSRFSAVRRAGLAEVLA